MTNSEQLLLDDNGLPILEDIVREDETPEPPDLRLATRIPAMAPNEIAGELLASGVFRARIGEIAATLSHTVCEHLEQALKPALEEAISQTLHDGDTSSVDSVREQLEGALPGLVAEALQEAEHPAG